MEGWVQIGKENFALLELFGSFDNSQEQWIRDPLFGLFNNNDNDKEDKIQKDEGASDTRKMD